MGRFTRIAAAGLLAVGIMGSAPHAFASGGNDGDVIKEGPCSGASDWKLKLSPENGRLEVEFEVDQNVIGDTWRVRMKDNGTVFFRGEAVTKGPSGSFEVRKLTTDQPGTDHVVALARNLSTSETCQGSASI
jgi:hypothetical protein